MSWILKIALGVFILYLIGAAALYFLQRRMVFSPDRERVLPAAFELDDVREVPLVTPEGHKLYSWYGKASQGQPTILFFHGNGGNVAYREGKFRQLMAEGYGVYMLGYRGFGGSGGSPSEAALLRDARLAYDSLKQEYDISADEIVIYGESIGTSIAVQLAADVPAAAVVLEAPMFSVTSIAQERYPFVPVRPFLRDRFETNRFIRDIDSPLLVVHGDDDGVIPIASGRALFEAANEPKRFEVIKGGQHTDLYSFDIVARMVRFFQEFNVDGRVRQP